MSDLMVFVRLFWQRKWWLILGAVLMATTLAASFGLLSLAGWFITATALAGLGAAGSAAVGFDIYRPGAGIRFFAILRTGSRYAERLATHEATFRILADLRLWLFRRAIPLDAAQLGRLRGGDVLNRLTADIDALDSLYLRVLAPTVVALVIAVAALLFIGWFDPVLAGLSVGILVVAGALVPAVAHRLGSRMGAETVSLSADLRTAAVDSVQGLTELKVFRADTRFQARMAELTDAIVDRQKRMARISGGSSAFSGLLMNLAVWSVVFVGLGRMESGHIQAPILVMIALATMALFEAVAPLPLAYQYLGRTRAAAGRILEIAHSEPSIKDPDTPVPAPAGNELAFQGVTFGYDLAKPAAVRHIDLTIRDGERVAVLGPSGVGKSTLINLALRLWDPWEGRVLLGGVDLKRLRRRDIWQRVAVMSQRTQIFAGTIRDNLLLGQATADDQSLHKALEAANLDSFVEALPDGLDTWVGENGVLISGGQARRLALARVILKDAPILLLDEPTEGLDEDTRRDLFDRLALFMEGRTVLLITHHTTGLEAMTRVLSMTPEGLSDRAGIGPGIPR